MSAAYLSLSRDHPRMCGEHMVQGLDTLVDAGSSPHVRGALTVGHATGREHGIIPACAGSTPNRSTASEYFRDHPRMCGEHIRNTMAARALEGSSPHVRGARLLIVLTVLTLGIIPACAGSTQALVHCPRRARDHPRMCGEHAWFEACRVELEGSSPHVRGARLDAPRVRSSTGIIPACAGSTRC